MLNKPRFPSVDQWHMGWNASILLFSLHSEDISRISSSSLLNSSADASKEYIFQNIIFLNRFLPLTTQDFNPNSILACTLSWNTTSYWFLRFYFSPSPLWARKNRNRTTASLQPRSNISVCFSRTQLLFWSHSSCLCVLAPLPPDYIDSLPTTQNNSAPRSRSECPEDDPQCTPSGTKAFQSSSRMFAVRCRLFVIIDRRISGHAPVHSWHHGLRWEIHLYSFPRSIKHFQWSIL